MQPLELLFVATFTLTVDVASIYYYVKALFYVARRRWGSALHSALLATMFLALTAVGVFMLPLSYVSVGHMSIARVGLATILTAGLAEDITLATLAAVMLKRSRRRA